MKWVRQRGRASNLLCALELIVWEVGFTWNRWEQDLVADLRNKGKIQLSDGITRSESHGDLILTGYVLS